MRRREVPGGEGVRGVRGPAEPRRGAALHVRRVQVVPVGGVRGGAGGRRRVGGVGAEPHRRGDGRDAGARGAQGRLVLVGARREDIQHHRLRRARRRLDAHRVPGHRPRRRRGQRRQDPPLRQAAAPQGDEVREPGVAGRLLRHRRRARQARVRPGQPRLQGQARPRRQQGRHGDLPASEPAPAPSPVAPPSSGSDSGASSSVAPTAGKNAATTAAAVSAPALAVAALVGFLAIV